MRSPVKRFDPRALAQSKESLDAAAAALPDGSDQWPFALRGSAGVQSAVQAEQARRPDTEAALLRWLEASAWPELDAVGAYLVQVRILAAVRVIDLLQSAPVVSENGSYDLLRWIFFVAWDKANREQWVTRIETWAVWYEAGYAEGREGSFSA